MKYLIWLVGVLLAGGLWPLSVLAEGASVVVNEVMWAKVEYVELYNSTEDEISLASWKLARQKPDQTEPEMIVEFGSDDKISAKSFYLLQMEGATTVEADKSLPSNRLVDGGMLLLLLDEGGGVVDQANKLGGWFAGKNEDTGKSMERINSTGSGEEASNWRTSTGSGGGRYGTPKASNSEEAANHPPVAVIEAPDSGVVGETLSFSATSSTDEDGDSLTYSWEFGDGETGTGKDVTHAYESAQAFTAKLTVGDGKATHVVSHPITISAPVYSSTLHINEFLPNPTGSDSGNEFIELINTSETAVDISGWKLDDIDGGSAPFVFPVGTLLAGGEIKAFFDVTTNITLNNDTDSARLLSPDGVVRSEGVHNSSFEGQSFNRVGGEYMASTTVTPDAINVITVPSSVVVPDPEAVYSTTVAVNEFLPNPTGSDTELEFIELKNVGSEEINLTHWKVDDGEGGSSGFFITQGTVLPAGDIIHFLSRDTNVSLSNGGDTVRLLNPNGVVVSAYTYESSAEGVSWNLVEGQYVESSTPTPGEANVITAVETGSSSAASSKESTSSSAKVAGANVIQTQLAQLKTLPLGSTVQFEGVVSVAPGVFGKTIMYAGVQLYSSKGFPSVAVGDVVRVEGKLSSVAKELRVLLATPQSMVKIRSGEEPTPRELKTGEVGEAWEGSLVHVVGAVTRSQGATFYIDDGSGEVRIFVRESTEIERPRLAKGMQLSMVGIVSQTESGYRVMPRNQADFGVGEIVTQAKKQSVRGRVASARAAVESLLPEFLTQGEQAPALSESNTLPVASRQLSPSLVFLGCMFAIVLLVTGFQSNEPLLLQIRN